MANLMTPENLQKIEFNVTTAEGPSRVTIVTGTMPTFLSANNATPSGSFKVLLDPTLTPGQFRKATATVSSSKTLFGSATVVGPVTLQDVQFLIDDAQATFDDEAGRVQLVVDLTIRSLASNMQSQINAVSFQVTTLAKV